MKISFFIILMIIVKTSMSSSAVAQDHSLQGKLIYEEFCEACHQAGGQGYDDIYPALIKNEFVLGEKTDVIYLMVEGRAGMPAFRNDLKPKEVTNIINYIRNSWGNKSDFIEVKDVVSILEELETDVSKFRNGS